MSGCRARQVWEWPWWEHYSLKSPQQSGRRHVASRHPRPSQPMRAGSPQHPNFATSPNKTKFCKPCLTWQTLPQAWWMPSGVSPCCTSGEKIKASPQALENPVPLCNHVQFTYSQPCRRPGCSTGTPGQLQAPDAKHKTAALMLG